MSRLRRRLLLGIYHQENAPSLIVGAFLCLKMTTRNGSATLLVMRPKTLKKICCCPGAKLFKPYGCGRDVDHEQILLTLEEMEALDLKNVKELGQIEAAERMGTSQSTFQRILCSAHKKVSRALVEGKAIKIEG